MSTSEDPNAELIQPTSAGLALIHHISPSIPFVDYPKNSVFPCAVKEETLCYVLQKGQITVHRESDDLLMSTLQAPAIIGLGSIFPLVDTVYIKTVGDCTLGMLPKPQVMEIIEEKDLWKPLANHLSALLNKLLLINQQLMSPSAYELIRTQLLLLMNEPDAYREKKPVSHYIQEKTLLSRSGIMKILSQLRQGGYIEIDNGILKKVNKLPAKY